MTASSVTSDQIQELYIAYFGRPAAPAGLAYWLFEAQNGASLNTIGANFAQSPELVAQIPGLVPTALTADSAGALVNNFFENLFGRQATPAGQLYWTEQLLNGAITVNNLGLTLIHSASTADALAIAAKVSAADSFDTNVSLNTTAILGYNSTDGSFAAAKTWLATVTNSTTETTALGTEAAVIANIVSHPTAPVILPSSVVTQSAQIFNAINVNSGDPQYGSTLLSFDNLTGSSPLNNNTLNIISDGSSLAAGITLTNIQTITINASNNQSVDTTGWSSVTALNINDVGGANGSQSAVITAGANTVVTVTGDDLSNGDSLTVNGGSSVTLGSAATPLTGEWNSFGSVIVNSPGANVAVYVAEAVQPTQNETFSDITVTGANVSITSTNTNTGVDYGYGGAINVTATGVVNVTSTDTLSYSGSSDVGDINVTGGTAVTVNSTVSITNAVSTGLSYIDINSPIATVVVNDTQTVAGGYGGFGDIDVTGVAVTITSSEIETSHAAAFYGGAINVIATGAINVIATGAINVTATGAVNVTSTDTIANAWSNRSPVGDITINGGTAVTINSTINAGSGNFYNGTITVNGTATTTAVIINSAVIDEALLQAHIDANSITVTGGTSVVVNETAGTTQTSTAADNTGNIGFIYEGHVQVNGLAATTSVTINQAADSNGTQAYAAVVGTAEVNAVTAIAAQPGLVAVAGVAAVSAVPGQVLVATGAPAVQENTVDIQDGKFATGTTTASNSITTVALSNYANGSQINDDALTNLSLSGNDGQLTITNNATGAGLTNTTLNLALNGVTGMGAGISDANNEIKTLAVTATGASTVYFDDTGLTTLTVTGSSGSSLTVDSLTVDEANTTKLASITISGAVSYNDSGALAGLGATLTSFTTTSSGTITATLDDTTQTFVGSTTGVDIITLANGTDATKTITGGAAGSEVILTGADTNYSKAGFGTHVTHFSTLGVTDGTGDTYDLAAVFTNGGTAYTGLDVTGSATGDSAFTNVTAGTTLAIDGNTGVVSYTLALPSTSATVAVSLTNAGGQEVGTLALNDSNNDGVATLNVTTDGNSIIDTVLDTALSTLSVSGAGGLSVGTVSLGQPNQTVPVGVGTFSLIDNSVGGVAINSLTDDTLGTLNLSGTGASTIGQLNDNTAVYLTINNTGAAATIATLATDDAWLIYNTTSTNDAIVNGLTHLSFTGSGAVDIQQFVDVTGATGAYIVQNTGTATDSIDAWGYVTGAGTLVEGAQTTSLTIDGNVALGGAVSGNYTSAATVEGALGTPLVFSSTAGVTIAAATDNARLNISLAGAATLNTDGITAGNGNNYITDASTTGIVNVHVGTGSNYIDVSAGNTTTTTIVSNASTVTAGTYVANVFLGTHTATTGSDLIAVGTVVTTLTVGDTVVTTLTVGDTAASTVITGATTGDIISFADATSAVQVTTAQQTAITALGTLALAVANVDALSTTVAHSATSFQFGGNTYIIESVGAGGGTLATGDSLIELVGVHTVTVGAVTNGHVVLA